MRATLCLLTIQLSGLLIWLMLHLATRRST